MSDAKEEISYTDKELRFIAEYPRDCNATQAAIRAGYSEKTAAVIGWENLRKPKIAKKIKKRLDELAMSAEEALKRLGEIARGTVDPFLSADENGLVHVHLGTDEAKDNYNLLRKVKQTRHITTVEDIVTEDVRTEFELHDAKSALVDILKMHGKFVDRHDITSGGEKLPATFNIHINSEAENDGTE